MQRNYYVSKMFFIAALLFVLTACSKSNGNSDENPQPEAGTYSAILCVGSWPNTAYYIADLPSLTEGTVSIKGNGAEMTGKVYAQDIIQKNGYYYHANFNSGRLGKYHVENGILIIDKEVPFTWLNWSSFAWVNDETLVVFGTGDGEGRYAVVRVSDMNITTGSLNLKALPNGFSVYNIGFAEYRDNKIFLGYSFGSDDWSQYPNMPVFQELDVAVINYPGMEVEKSVSDTKTTTPGGPTVYAPASFKDETGDIYFISDPVSGYDYTSPSLVYRIKNGETELDASYSFDLSAATANGMGAAMWYIGDGQAIVRTRVAGQSIDADHSFSVINVHTGTFIKKLDLPADKGERMVNAIIVEDGNAYIAVNAADRDYIWKYNVASGELTRGLEFVGGIDYILRIEKLK